MERITNPTPLGFGTLRVMGMIRRRGYGSSFTLISGSDSKEKEVEEDAPDESHVALASPTALADSPPPAAVPMDTETVPRHPHLLRHQHCH